MALICNLNRKGAGLMKENIRILAILGILVFFSFVLEVGAQQDWTQQINDFKPMVVNIETATEIVLENESQGVGYATGFIVDAERGIIATNAHVTGISPAYTKVNFFDGSFTEAKTLYYDAVHDFAFLKIDPDSVEFELQEVGFGAWKKLKVGDEVLLIGNNEKEEYSIKFGSVANLNVEKGDYYSSYIHTTFDRAGGSSGSPVWNTKGQVVGIHAAGDQTSSFELPIEYLQDILNKIVRGKPVVRGGIGVELKLLSIGEAVRHFNYPKSLCTNRPDSTNGVPKVMQVEAVIPGSSAENMMRPGDLLHRINNQVMEDDLYLFDTTLNRYVGKTVSIELYRNGLKKEVSVKVQDLEKIKIRRFVRFAGGTFHDIKPRMRWYHDYHESGVYLAYADQGSSASKLGRCDRETQNMAVIVKEINGRPVRNLDDFIAVSASLADGTHTFVLRQDLSLYQSAINPCNLSLNLKYSPLELYDWNRKTLEWVQIEIGKDKIVFLHK